MHLFRFALWTLRIKAVVVLRNGRFQRKVVVAFGAAIFVGWHKRVRFGFVRVIRIACFQPAVVRISGIRDGAMVARRVPT